MAKFQMQGMFCSVVDRWSVTSREEPEVKEAMCENDLARKRLRADRGTNWQLGIS
jgi:hypothetical protein